MANLEQMKEEALKRMEKLKLHKNVLEDFKNGVLNKSERQNAIFNGILYHLDKEEEKDVIQKIKEFEEKYGGIVYHVIMDKIKAFKCDGCKHLNDKLPIVHQKLL